MRILKQQQIFIRTLISVQELNQQIKSQMYSVKLKVVFMNLRRSLNEKTEEENQRKLLQLRMFQHNKRVLPKFYQFWKNSKKQKNSSEILVVKSSEEEVSGSQRRKHIGCLCTGMEHGFAQAALWPSPGNVLRRFYRDPYAAN